MKKNFGTNLLILFAICTLLAACGPSAESLSGTADAALAQTQTAGYTPAPTLKPTRTHVPTPDRTGTAVARATEEMSFFQENVAPDLEVAGLSFDKGELGYKMESPISISINQGGNWRYFNQLETNNPVFSNFVISVDITWQSETGLAGCDIVFRSDGDMHDGEFVRFQIVRLSGFPGWNLSEIKFNRVQGRLTSTSNTSPAIELETGSTNHFVLVVNGKNVSAYANGTLLGHGLMSAHITEGEIFFQAWQESKATTCVFSNAWVWDLSD